MPDIKKWNYLKRAYEPYTPPAGRISLYEPVMETPIVCASCGKRMTFGDGYTSLILHNFAGFGYSVCESCHSTELDEEIENRRKMVGQ